MKRNKTVLNGKDYEALEILIELHGSHNPVILDCTYNTGKMWNECRFQPTTKSDINPEFKTDVIADFTKTPFLDKSFDIVVFDPPHLLTNAASVNSSKIWEKTYGITADDELRKYDNVSNLFLPFLKEAKRILTQDGIVLAKIADIVHNHKYQWHQVDFINAAKEVGMTPCDMLIKCDPNAGNLSSSKWRNIKHLRKSHCYWIVTRNSKKCESKKMIL